MQKAREWRGEFADRPRQTFYALWGMEEPRRVSNAHSLYRYGDRGLWNRYIIAPKAGIRYLDAGWTIGDTVVTVAVVAFLLLLAQPLGAAYDNYADMMGW